VLYFLGRLIAEWLYEWKERRRGTPFRVKVSTPVFVAIGVAGLAICAWYAVESTGAWLVASIVLGIGFATAWVLNLRARRSDSSRST
jgi:hypothetical protein